MADDRREFAVAAPARRTRWWRWGLAALLAVVAVVQATLLPGPRSLSYHLTDDALVVDARCGLWDLGRTLDRAALGPASPADLQGAQKLRGSDFPELCTGWWRVPAVGEVWLGSSCGPDGVVLEAEGVGTVALTPARPEAFAATCAPRLRSLPKTSPSLSLRLSNIALSPNHRPARPMHNAECTGGRNSSADVYRPSGATRKVALSGWWRASTPACRSSQSRAATCRQADRRVRLPSAAPPRPDRRSPS